ncbi:HEPN family nuclease [Pseudomonas lini]
MEAWGFRPDCIVNAGAHKTPQEINLRELVRRLRNAVAHCNVSPFPNDHRPCEGFFSSQIEIILRQRSQQINLKKPFERTSCQLT